MRRQVGVMIANKSPYYQRMIGNHFATNRRLVADEARIQHRLITDHSLDCKVPALF